MSLPCCRLPAARRQQRLAARAQLAAQAAPPAEVDWDSLGFGLSRVGAVRTCLASCVVFAAPCNGISLCCQFLHVLLRPPATPARTLSLPPPPCNGPWRPTSALQHFVCRVAVPQTMWMASCDAVDGKWSSGDLQPYGPLPMYPSAQALNYGQVGTLTHVCNGCRMIAVDMGSCTASHASTSTACWGWLQEAALPPMPACRLHVGGGCRKLRCLSCQHVFGSGAGSTAACVCGMLCAHPACPCYRFARRLCLRA